MLTIDMYASPLWAVTLQTEQKARVKILKDTIYFSFCHPLRNLPAQLDVDEVHANAEQSSLVAFLLVRGFMYFNKDYEIIHINSLHVNVKHVIHLPADHEAGQPPSAGSGSESRLMLERWGLDMQPRSVELLDRWSRWQPITAPALKKQFEEFTWVGPSEMLCDRWINPYGGFAYRAANSETAVFYAIRLPGEYNVLYDSTSQTRKPAAAALRTQPRRCAHCRRAQRLSASTPASQGWWRCARRQQSA